MNEGPHVQEQKNVSAQPIEYAWGESKHKGTPECAVQFLLLDGPDKGKKITAHLYFTDATTERALQSLMYCGCTFPNGDIFNMDGFGTKNPTLTIEHEEYEGKLRARVAWVNAGMYAPQEMDAAKKQSFRDRMRANIAVLKKAQPQPAWDGAGASMPDGDIPF